MNVATSNEREISSAGVPSGILYTLICDKCKKYYEMDIKQMEPLCPML